MKKNVTTITAILLVISLVNLTKLMSNSSIRTVEFLSVFAVGLLAGLLLHQLVNGKKN